MIITLMSMAEILLTVKEWQSFLRSTMEIITTMHPGMGVG